MNLSYVFAPFLLIIGFLCSCSDARQSGNATAFEDSEPTDTVISEVIQDDQEEEEEAPEVKHISLPSRENQLAYMHESGAWDRYQSGILPQMVEDAPEYSRQILETEGKRFIVVDKAKMKLFLYDPYGNVEKSYGIACAKNYGTKHKKGDSRTTEGIFKVKGVFDSTEWLFTDDNGYTSPKKGQYGPRFIRLNIPYIGIHGTGSPGSIGKRCSHGCIRVTNPNILELVKYVEEGMPVIISPGPRDMAVNEKEGYKILAVATEPGSKPARPGWINETKPENEAGENSTDVTTDETESSSINPEENAAPETEVNPVEENLIETEKSEPSKPDETATETII